MKKGIIGKKIGMTQIFDEKGNVIPVTVIAAGPCTVTQKKTAENDGYEAVQLGYEDIAERKLSQPEKGHLAKAGVSAKKHNVNASSKNTAKSTSARRFFRLEPNHLRKSLRSTLPLFSATGSPFFDLCPVGLPLACLAYGFFSAGAAGASK